MGRWWRARPSSIEKGAKRTFLTTPSGPSMFRLRRISPRPGRAWKSLRRTGVPIEAYPEANVVLRDRERVMGQKRKAYRRFEELTKRAMAPGSAAAEQDQAATDPQPGAEGAGQGSAPT